MVPVSVTDDGGVPGGACVLARQPLVSTFVRPAARIAKRSPRTILVLRPIPFQPVMTACPADLFTRIESTPKLLDTVGQVTGTFLTAWFEATAPAQPSSVEHRTKTPYWVVNSGAATKFALSVQSRSRMSGPAPTFPSKLASFQNWYCRIPLRHLSAVEFFAVSVTIRPGAARVTGSASRIAEISVQLPHGSGDAIVAVSTERES